MWDQKELQEHFEMAVKERKMMELLLAELEEEHDMAIAKIEKLERKVKDCIHVPSLSYLLTYLFNY